MSISTAFTAGAYVNSAVAVAEANEAKRIACQGVVQHFQSDGATIEQAQQYADCISRLYPHTFDSGEIMLIKAAILTVIAGAVIGATLGAEWILGWQPDGLKERIMSGFMGAVIAGGLVIVFAFLFVAVQFLFS